MALKYADIWRAIGRLGEQNGTTASGLALKRAGFRRPLRCQEVAIASSRTRKSEVLVKQLGRDITQKIELISLNPAFGTANLPCKDIEWIYRILWASQ